VERPRAETHNVDECTPQTLKSSPPKEAGLGKERQAVRIRRMHGEIIAKREKKKKKKKKKRLKENSIGPGSPMRP